MTKAGVFNEDGGRWVGKEFKTTHLALDSDTSFCKAFYPPPPAVTGKPSMVGNTDVTSGEVGMAKV